VRVLPRVSLKIINALKTTGCAVAWDGHFKAQTEGDLFSAVIDLLLNCAAFIYIGAWLPFASYNMPELGIVPYRLILLFLCILVLRRIPALLLLYPWVPEIRDWKEALFSGHFGENHSDQPSFLVVLTFTSTQDPSVLPFSQYYIFLRPSANLARCWSRLLVFCRDAEFTRTTWPTRISEGIAGSYTPTYRLLHCPRIHHYSYARRLMSEC
jgi:hypothetical protein